MSKTPAVIFTKVSTNQAKLNAICKILSELFHSKANVLVLAPTREAAIYIDELLWRLPPESFLPHQYTNELTDERIAISTECKKINQASVLLNLHPTAPAFLMEFETVFDLFDETSPDKINASKLKIDAYKERGCQILDFRLI